MTMEDWKSRKQSLRAHNPNRSLPCLLMVYAGTLDSHEVGCRYDLSSDELILGRSSDADIQIDRDSVSRRHARIARTEEGWAVSDLQSTNGTYINDQPVREQVLRDGDYLKIGNTIFRFVCGPNILAAVHEENYRIATMCALTQTCSRRYFVDLLEREMARARHYGRPLSIVGLDIDNLKQVNESFGHLTGDQVIQELARRTNARLDRFELLCRFEGSQFLLLLPEVEHEAARLRGEELRKAISAEPIRSEGDVIPVTLSGGIASLTEEADAPAFVSTVQELIQKAKRAGKNQLAS